MVAEHTSPVKSKFVDIVGFYNVSRDPRELKIDEEKIKYWISVGAQPTDTVASLLKKHGMEGMDKYIGRRDLQRKKKKATEEDAGDSGSAKVTEAPAEETADAPAEEAADAPAEEVADAPAEEKPEEPKEEAPAEEAKEEAPAEESKEEEPPTEEAADTPASDEKSEEAS